MSALHFFSNPAHVVTGCHPDAPQAALLRPSLLGRVTKLLPTRAATLSNCRGPQGGCGIPSEHKEEAGYTSTKEEGTTVKHY